MGLDSHTHYSNLWTEMYINLQARDLKSLEWLWHFPLMKTSVTTLGFFPP